MMQNYDVFRLTGKLMNMTKHTIRLYDEHTGEIKRFPVSKRTLPLRPVRTDGGNIAVHYVYEETEVEKIRRSKRKLDDIAVIREHAIGRGGKEVVCLVWAKDMTTRILLCSTYLPDGYI